MIRYFIIFCFCASALAARRRSSAINNEKIVGGRDADISEAPYQASVQYYGDHICGGAIIHPKTIITAAHCVYGKDPDGFSVRLGSSKHENGGTIYFVMNITIHDHYDDYTTENDIALLHLKETISGNNNTKMIKIGKRMPPTGALVTVTGWGSLTEGGGASDTLQTVEVPVQSTKMCKKQLESHNPVTQNMFCAGYSRGGKDSCQGDSGGPAVYKDALVGIVSWGVGCAGAHLPGVYTKLSRMLEWLKFFTEFLIG